MNTLASEMTLRAKLRKSKTQKGKSYLIAVDGSNLSMRAVKLAGFLAHPFDSIKVFTIQDGAAATSLDEYKTVLKTMCKRPTLALCEFKTVPLKAEYKDDIKGQMVEFANQHPASILILGAAGRKMEDAEKTAGKRRAGEAPLGSVAKACVSRVIGPVILVKKKATPDIDDERRLRDRTMSDGSAGSAGIHIMCCVDGSTLSQRCLDYATHIAQGGDTVSVLFVRDTDKAMIHMSHAANAKLGESQVESSYRDQIAKLDECTPNTTFRFTAKSKHGSIPDTLLEVSESEQMPADIVLLGSVQLAKVGTDGEAMGLGSVSAVVLQKTGAHPMIVKNFATSAMT